MTMLRSKKYKAVLVTARCSLYDPFRSLQYNVPPSNAESDNVRVELSICNSKRLKYFCDTYSYPYTRGTDGNLYEFVRH